MTFFLPDTTAHWGHNASLSEAKNDLLVVTIVLGSSWISRRPHSKLQVCCVKEIRKIEKFIRITFPMPCVTTPKRGSVDSSSNAQDVLNSFFHVKLLFGFCCPGPRFTEYSPDLDAPNRPFQNISFAHSSWNVLQAEKKPTLFPFIANFDSNSSVRKDPIDLIICTNDWDFSDFF